MTNKKLNIRMASIMKITFFILILVISLKMMAQNGFKYQRQLSYKECVHCECRKNYSYKTLSSLTPDQNICAEEMNSWSLDPFGYGSLLYNECDENDCSHEYQRVSEDPKTVTVDKCLTQAERLELKKQEKILEQKNAKIRNDNEKIIVDYLDKKKFDEAIKNFNKLNKNDVNNLLALKEKIRQAYIQEYYKSQPILELSKEDLLDIMGPYAYGKYLLDLLNRCGGKATLLFDESGKGFFNNTPTTMSSLIYISRPVIKELDNFQIYGKTKCELELSKEIKEYEKKQKNTFMASPNDKVYEMNNKVFRYSFVSQPIKSKSKSYENVKYSKSIYGNIKEVRKDKRIESGKYWILQPKIEVVKINSIDVSENPIEVKIDEKPLKRRLLVSLSRITTILAASTWITLRYLEYSTVK